jgi:hypothetical protein
VGSPFSVESRTFTGVAVLHLIILGVVRGHSIVFWGVYLCTCLAILCTGDVMYLDCEHIMGFVFVGCVRLGACYVFVPMFCFFPFLSCWHASRPSEDS